jgi:DNA-binding NtrC family response regulator
MEDSRTILLVDDERAIRVLLCHSLRKCGYTTLEASSGPDALEITRGYEQPIDVLVSDVVMPGMSGPQLAHEMCSARPELKVLLISGFAGAPVGLERDWEFLQKPFLPSALCEKLQLLCAHRRIEEELRGEMRRAREEYVRSCHEFTRRVAQSADLRLAAQARQSALHAYAAAVRRFADLKK